MLIKEDCHEVLVMTAGEVEAEIFPLSAEDYCGRRPARRLQSTLSIIDFLRSLNMKANLGISFIDIYRNKGVSTPRFNLEGQSRLTLKRVGEVLMDLAGISEKIILPAPGPEILQFAIQTYEAVFTGKPMKIYTPACPDWSRDNQGVYDFKSLETGPSYIVEKLVNEAPAILGIFAKHEIPCEGVVVFADWGMETEITAKDTYGRQLAQDEMVERFVQSFQATGNLLLTHKEKLFTPYRLQSMTEFLALNLGDPVKVCRQFQNRFLIEERAQRLLRLYQGESLIVNQKRLGLSEKDNNKVALQTLSEYATFGAAIKEGVVLAAESRLASLAYNVFRSKKNRLPLVFLKGKESLSQGVNIL